MTLPLPLRPNIASLRPYASARSILKGNDWIFLDANEGPSPAFVQMDALPPLNRYPDPTADALRDAVAGFYSVDRGNLMIGNGSDELIDLCIRTFVRPGRGVVALQPSYGMYRVSADINGVPFTALPLEDDFSLDSRTILTAAAGADVLFLCSPNNPTGLTIDRPLIEHIVQRFSGLVVIDEAYGEFSDAAGFPSSIDLVRSGSENLLVMRTFSKAFSAAAIRVGYGVASKSLIDVLLRVKPPYNVNALSQSAALALWNDRPAMERRVRDTLSERDRLMRGVENLGCRIFPTCANFFLMKLPASVSNDEVYATLRDRYKIVLRKFDDLGKLKNVLRITVGSPQQNNLLLSSLSSLL